MGLHRDQLLSFILRYQDSWRRVELVFVGLLTISEYLKPPYSQVFDTDNWKFLFGRMTTLSLEHLLIKSPWVSWDGISSRSQRCVNAKTWCGEHHEVIQDLLQSEGEGAISSLGATISS